MCFYYGLGDKDVQVCSYPEEEKIVKNSNGKICGVYLYAKDEEHAKKKAYDVISQYMAEQLGL